MDFFTYKNDKLFAEDVRVEDIIAKHGTPAYIYSKATLVRHWHAFNNAVSAHKHLICYAVKANSNIGVLSVLAKLGSGFDIVSGGELARVIHAGGDPAKVVFSGVAKTQDEIAYALNQGIKCFNVESLPELDRINEVAKQLGKQAPISLRINPDVDAKTHPYISTGLKANKFGIAKDDAIQVYEYANSLSNLNIQGMDCHIGSQITELSPFVDTLERLLALIDELATKGIHIAHLDVGGGLGVKYNDETPPHPNEYAAAMATTMHGREDLMLILEPGRAIAANAGILVTKVEFLKQGEQKNFAIVDAAMNDLIRPALYNAWQKIEPTTIREGQGKLYDVVGPVCETGDFLGKDRLLNLAPNDYLAVKSAGAYGFVMASNYNSRCRCPEIMVDGSTVHLVREREVLSDLWKGEQRVPSQAMQNDASNDQYETRFAHKHKKNLIHFSKMHGLGNDFVVIDNITQNVFFSKDKILALADRNFGIGFDQLLLVEPPYDPEQDFHYRIFNADGSEVSQCGNGARCFARFVRLKGLINRNKISVSTKSGRMILYLEKDGNVTVNMGRPNFVPEQVPFKAIKQENTYIIREAEQTFFCGVASMGNPHCVIEVPNIDNIDIATIGPLLGKHERFSEGVNVGFMQIINKHEVKLRVFERGVGETLACGSGACAAVAIGQIQGKLGQDVKVVLLGGELKIRWQGGDSMLKMTGPAQHIYDGQISI